MPDIDSPEGKAAIAAAVAEATEALAVKNRELLREVKAARKGAEVDPAEHQAALERAEAAEAKAAEAGKLAKQSQADAEKYRKAAEQEAGYTSRLLVENGLNEALGKAGVKPEFQKAARAMLAGQVQVKQDGDSRAVLLGEKPLSDAVAEWAKSDEGKHFVAAPVNSGGGAQGSGAKPPSKQLGRAEFDTLAPLQKAQHIQSGGVVVDPA